MVMNNFCAGQLSTEYGAGVVLEGNITLGGGQGNRYGGAMLCQLNNITVAAGASYSSFPQGMLGVQPGDTIEIIRGSDTAAVLIIWGVVTAANTVVTTAYNPTASGRYTGNNTCSFRAHRNYTL